MVLLNKCTMTLHVVSTVFLCVVFDQIDAMPEENPPLRNGTIVNFTISTIGSNCKLKETRSVTMNIFRKKSFVKIELSYVFTINIIITVENCMEK